MSSSTSVLRLYREMLRNASKFQSYNYRSYAVRRVKLGFHENKSLAEGSAEQKQALELAREQANVLYRQVVISNLYPSQGKNVIETLGA